MHTSSSFCAGSYRKGLKWLNHNYQQRLRLKSSAHSFPTGFSVSSDDAAKIVHFSNCIMSFPYFFLCNKKNIQKSSKSSFRALWRISSSRSSWWNKVINYPAFLLPSFSPFTFPFVQIEKILIFFSCDCFLVPTQLKANFVEYSQLMATLSRRKSSWIVLVCRRDMDLLLSILLRW